MSNGILVFAEQREGVLNKTSYEAIAAGQALAGKLGQTVSAVILGSGVRNLAEDLAAFELSKVIYAENDKLKDYTPDAHTDAMERVVRGVNPQFVVMPHTYL